MKRFEQNGAALVVTLIVLTALAVIAVAMISTTSMDRIAVSSSANIYRAQLAAEAGLQTAVTILRSSAGPNMTLSLNRTNSDPTRWSLLYNTISLNGSVLSSNSSLPSGIAPIGNQTHTFALPTGNRTAPKFPIPNPSNPAETIGSFSYVVIDNSAKQSLARFPAPPETPVNLRSREFSTSSLNQVPFITANLSVATPPSTITSNQIAALPSPASANLLFNQDLGINSKWVDTKSYAPNIAPDGRPKLNLRLLKHYVDARAITQTVGNPKAQVIEALLGQNSTVNATTSWGGGGLTWLTSPQNPRPYSLTEARQIAANLIDYIDDDLHPTTDNVDNPTYFGTEGRLTANGTVQGHPYITSGVLGLIFNLNGTGLINSTRLIASFAIVNPWQSDINLGSYSLNMSISVQGSASGGNLSNNASAYFNQSISQNLTGQISANSGQIFPTAPGNGPHFAIPFDMWNSVGRQPAGMSFSSIAFRINFLKLEFQSTDPMIRTSIQTLSNLRSLNIPMMPSNFTVPLSTPYFPSGGNTRAINGFFLNGDPRLSFQPSQWILGNISSSAAASTSPPPSNPAVSLFSGMNATRGDGIQGLPSNHTWYSSPNTRNHFYVRSPPVLSANPATAPFNPTQNPNGQVAMESVAELGYISTGRPWQTLRMVVDPANIAAGGDYSILDFIETGTMNSTFATTIAMSSNTTIGNQTVTNGQVNPNTLLLPTATGLFQDIPWLPASEASDRASLLALSSNATGYPFTRPGAIGALPQMARPGATTKFRREDLMRAVSNLLTTQSTEFTILSHGESINPRNNQVVSRATMESTVRVLTINGTTTHTITSRKLE